MDILLLFVWDDHLQQTDREFFGSVRCPEWPLRQALGSNDQHQPSVDSAAVDSDAVPIEKVVMVASSGDCTGYWRLGAVSVQLVVL